MMIQRDGDCVRNWDVVKSPLNLQRIQFIFLHELVSHLTRSQIQMERSLSRQCLYQSSENAIFRKRQLLEILYRASHGLQKLHNFALSSIGRNAAGLAGRIALSQVIDNCGSAQCLPDVAQDEQEDPIPDLEKLNRNGDVKDSE
jgi:hypothetical protein